MSNLFLEALYFGILTLTSLTQGHTWPSFCVKGHRAKNLHIYAISQTANGGANGNTCHLGDGTQREEAKKTFFDLE